MGGLYRFLTLMLPTFSSARKLQNIFSLSQVLYLAKPILGGHQLALSAPDLVMAVIHLSETDN